MQIHSLRNSALAAMAVSIASTLVALWAVSATGKRDDELGARGRDLSALQRFTIRCGRATRLAAECANGSPVRDPAELRSAVEDCDAQWTRVKERTSPAFAGRVAQLEAAGDPLRRSMSAVVAQCLNGGPSRESAATLAGADERFGQVVTQLLAETEEDVRIARERWDQAHRRIEIATVVTGLWAFGVALAMTLSMRRMASARVALEGEKSRASELDAFASRAAHDLRGLLTPLPFIASSLVRAQGDSARLEALARRLEGTSKRAARMIDALLAFARLGNVGTVGSCDVPTVVEDLLTDLGPVVANVGATVRTEGVRGRARMDGALFYAVLMNLVTNALKFMRDRPERRLTLTGQLHNEEVEVVVEDTGPGIPREDLEKVFEPFFRSKPGGAPGVGLGLATVAKIVRAHGGSVTIDSEVGKGTRVCVRVPCESATVRPDPAKALLDDAPGPQVQ